MFPKEKIQTQNNNVSSIVTKVANFFKRLPLNNQKMKDTYESITLLDNQREQTKADDTTTQSLFTALKSKSPCMQNSAELQW